jgi:serine protease Do
MAQTSIPAAPPVLALVPEAPEPPEPPDPPKPPNPAGWVFNDGRSFLGVHVAEIDSSRSKELNLKEERGVEITGIEEGSPAEKAGLRKGDVVLEYNGHAVDGTQQFVRLVQETPAGRQVKLSVHRNGSPFTITASVGTRKGRVITRSRSGAMVEVEPPRVNVWVPDIPRATMTWGNSLLGVEAETVDGQLAEFFGVKEGALVRSVSQGSAAEKAGLKAGDVVTKLDQSKVASARELLNLVRSSRGKKTYPVTVVRDKKEVTVSVTTDEESAGAPGRRTRTVVRSDKF